MFSIAPLSFDASSRGTRTNIRINLILPESTFIALHLCRYGSTFVKIFAEGSENACILKQNAKWPFKVIQGHGFRYRSIARTHLSSIVIFVLSCPVSAILQVFCWEERPHPIPPQFWGCSHWTRLPMLWLRCANTPS